MAAARKAGEAPKENIYQFKLQCAFDNNDTPGTVAALKQYDITTFLGHNQNAIRLQIVAAMIAYLLLRLAARENLVKIPIIRLAGLIADRLFLRMPIAKIDKPPDVHPSKPKPAYSLDQLEFDYA